MMSHVDADEPKQSQAAPARGPWLLALAAPPGQSAARAVRSEL